MRPTPVSLDHDTWEHHTKGMPVGGRRRVPHFCGPGSPLLLSRDGRGIRAYCFRCDDSGFIPGERESTAEVLARLQSSRAADAATTSALPTPAVTDLAQWPEAAKVWLYKAGMGAAEIADFGAYFHPPTGRVVLPFGGYWTARSVDGRLPKYLGAPSGREQCVPQYGTPGAPIAITEDALSAWKVGKAGGWGWCCLGVKPSARMLSLLLATGQTEPLVWLDNDHSHPSGINHGQVAARKIMGALQAVGLQPRNVVSRCDPKLLQINEIQQFLKGAAC